MSIGQIQVEELQKIFVRYFRSSLVFKLVGLLFLICWGASISGIIPSFLTSILALLWIVYVPFGIGNFILFVMKMVIWLRVRRFSVFVNGMRIASILIKWFMGFLLILGVELLAHLTHTNIPASILGPSLLLISISIQFLPRTKTIELETTRIQIGKGMIKMLLISLLVGLSFALYVRSFSPYPLSPGFDVFAHVYVIKSVLSGIIDTSTVVYFPSFHILVAPALATFNANVIDIFWSGSLLLFSLFAISIYAMSFWLTRNELSSLVVTIIGLSITEMGWVPSMQVFYPSSLVMSIFPMTFFVIGTIWASPNRFDKGKFPVMSRLKPNNIKFQIIVTLMVFAGMIMIHPDLGLVADLILLSYLVVIHYVTKSNSLLLLVRVATVSIGIILLFYLWGYITFQALLIHNFGGKMVDLSYLYNTSIKVMHLGQWYSIQIITISVAGLIVLSFFNDRKTVVLGFLASIILLIYFQNIVLIDRIMTLERPLLAFAAATLLMLPVSVVFKRDRVFGQVTEQSKSSIFHFAKIAKLRLEKLSVLTLSQPQSRTTLVYTIIVVILLFPVMMKPYDIYISPYSEHADAFANFSYQELNAAKYIEKATPHNYLIFSDPFTVLEMRGLAFRENIPDIGWSMTVAKSVKSLMMDQSAHDAYKKIMSKYGNKLLIVITPRTSEWLRNINLNSDVAPNNYFVSFPIENFKSFEGFAKFFDYRYFNLIYKSDNIFVFTPKAPTMHQ
jgi:hypothetical protein